MRYALMIIMSLAVAYVVIAPVAAFVGQSFEAAALRLNKGG